VLNRDNDKKGKPDEEEEPAEEALGAIPAPEDCGMTELPGLFPLLGGLLRVDRHRLCRKLSVFLALADRKFETTRWEVNRIIF
jgi:hypothetical protein